MSDLAYRLFHDTGLAILICKVTRRHAWTDAGWRAKACTRCHTQVMWWES